MSTASVASAAAQVELPDGRVGTELRGLLKLAAPVAATQAGFALMGLVDTAVVGRLGARQLGAVGLANGLFFAVAVVGLGIMMGLDPLLSQALGARDERRAGELLWQGVWLALGVTVVLAVPILLSPLLLRPLRVPEAIEGDARAFLLSRAPGLLPMLLFAGLRACLQAHGITRPLVVATVLANVANLLLDLLLVFGGGSLPPWSGPLRAVPPLGAAGAGLATTLCSVVQVLVLAAAVRKLPGHRLHPRRAPHAADLCVALGVGLPVGLQMGAEVGVFALVGLLAARLGAEALAAHQVAISLASFTFCFAVGIGQAGSVRVGWAVGARNTPAARLCGLCAFAVGAGFMSVSALCFWLFPRQLAALFSGGEEVARASVPLLAVAAVFQISDGVQGVGAGVLRGAGDTRFAFAANLFGHYLIGLPLAVVLAFVFGLGVFGLWWGLCAGLSAVAVCLFARFWRLSRRELRPLEAR
jgi:MATE family multidrug resistance protein